MNSFITGVVKLQAVEMGERPLDLELRGRTWSVYWYMLSKGARSEVTVREVQRMLGFKSPSIAAHHLDRLRNLGLVIVGGSGGYMLTGEVKIGVLRHFVRLGRVMVPRFVFYGSFTSILVALYALFIYPSVDVAASAFVAALGVFSSAAFWYEAYRFWKLRPY